MSSITKLIRKHLINLKPYSSARDEFSGQEGVFMDANENPFSSVTGQPYNRYPDPHQKAVKLQLAALKGVQPDQVFLGNGSDEAIDLLTKLFCEPKEDAVLVMPPTYGMYKVCADIQEVAVMEVPLTDDYDIDLDALEKLNLSAVKLIWVCTPNNPSGNDLTHEKILQLLIDYPDKIVVVDEAYNDFTEAPSFIEKLPDFDNLVVIQTFSKAWGMAGLRVGMAFASPLIISYLDKIKYPYNINILTQNAILAALGNAGRVQEFVDELNENREWLRQELQQLQRVEAIYPSNSNQLLVKFKNADELYNELIADLVIVRNRSSVLKCDDCIRISVGTRDEIAVLLDSLKKYDN